MAFQGDTFQVDTFGDFVYGHKVYQPTVVHVVACELIESGVNVFSPAAEHIAEAQTIASTVALFAPAVAAQIEVQFIATASQVFDPANIHQAISTLLLGPDTNLFEASAIADQFINANLIASSVEVFEPTTSIGATTIEANLVASNVQVFDPVNIHQTVDTQLIGPTGVVFSPENVHQSIDANLIAAVTALFSPDVVRVVSVPQIASAIAVFDPEAIHQTVSANLIGPDTALFEPLATTGSAIGAHFITGGTNIFSPAVAQFVVAQTISAATTLFDPLTAYVVEANVISNTALFSPENIHITIFADAIGQTSVVFNPVASQLGAPQSIDAVLLTGGTSVFQAEAIADQFVEAEAIAPITSVLAPAASHTVETNLISNTVVYGPSVEQSVEALALSPQTLIFDPSVGYLVLTPPVGSSIQVFGPEVSAGDVALVAIALNSNVAVHPPAVLSALEARHPRRLLPTGGRQLTARKGPLAQLRSRSGRQLG